MLYGFTTLNIAVLFLITRTCATASTRVPYVFFLSPTDLDSKPERREGGGRHGGDLEHESPAYAAVAVLAFLDKGARARPRGLPFFPSLPTQ